MVNNKDYDNLLDVLLTDISLTVEEMALSFEQIAVELAEDKAPTDKNITVEEAGEEIISYYNNKKQYSEIYTDSEKKRMEFYSYKLENLLNITAHPYYVSMLKTLNKTLVELEEPTDMVNIVKSMITYIVYSLEKYQFDEALHLFEEMFDRIQYGT